MNLKPDLKWGESWKVGNTINDNFQSKAYLIDFKETLQTHFLKPKQNWNLTCLLFFLKT